MGKVLPFRWYGGKYNHLDWLLDHLPQRREYVEPFGGSAAVLLNRSPAKVETFNDLDSDVTTFFRVLRDQQDELLEKIALTPFSREEYERAISRAGEESLDDIEQARLFLVRAGQVRSGLAQDATPGRWAYHVETSRRDMAGGVSRWWGRLDDLDTVADRLRRVQIENDNAIEVIERYDTENCLIYCDPPYPHGARSDDKPYRYEMDDSDHRELAEVLHGCDADVAISSYRCDLMDELYAEWRLVEAPEKVIHTSKDTRQECLWLNYDPDDESGRRSPEQASLSRDYSD